MNKSKIGKMSLIGLSLLTAGLAGCWQWEEGGPRNDSELSAIAHHLRTDCKPNGYGIEVVHGGGWYKTESFTCPDGSFGVIPYGVGR